MGLNLISALSAAGTIRRPALRSVQRWSLRRALVAILAISVVGWALIVAVIWLVMS
jgi:hypothetical protein